MYSMCLVFILKTETSSNPKNLFKILTNNGDVEAVVSLLLLLDSGGLVRFSSPG